MTTRPACPPSASACAFMRRSGASLLVRLRITCRYLVDLGHIGVKSLPACRPIPRSAIYYLVKADHGQSGADYRRRCWCGSRCMAACVLVGCALLQRLGHSDLSGAPSNNACACRYEVRKLEKPKFTVLKTVHSRRMYARDVCKSSSCSR